MKKIKIKQPFASMVICGAFQTIPNLWENVLHGETIYIYAEGVDESFSMDLTLKMKFTKVFGMKCLSEISLMGFFLMMYF